MWCELTSLWAGGKKTFNVYRVKTNKNRASDGAAAMVENIKINAYIN